MTRKIFLSLTIYFLLLTFFSASAATVNAQKKPSDKAKKEAKLGDQFFKQKDYRNAVNKYAEAVALSPVYPYAHFWKGYAHYYLNEFDEAITDFDLASEQDYKPLKEIYKVRWYLHFEKKNYDAALKDVQEALKLEPTNSTLNLGLANILREQGSYGEALEIYKKVAQSDPNNADIPYFMALTYSKTGDIAAQETAATEAVQRNSQFIGESYYLLGDALQKNKKYDEAIRAYERAVSINARILEVYLNLGEVYRSQNNYDKAIMTGKKGLQSYQNNGNLFANLSWYYSLAERYPEAVAAARDAIRLLPKQDSTGHKYLCRAYNDSKQFSQAISACNEALKISPNDGEANFYLGRAYDKTNKPNLAPKFYDKAVVGLIEYTQKNPEISDGFYLLGSVYFAHNQKDKAIDAFKRSIQLNPNFGKARVNLGYIYFLNKNISAAREQYNALLKIDKVKAEELKQLIS